VLIIFFGAAHDDNAASIARQVVTRLPRTSAPGKITSSQPVQILPQQQKFPELNQPIRQPGESIKHPQSLFEKIEEPVKPLAPGMGKPLIPKTKRSHYETLKNIQISEKPQVINPEILENIESLQKEGYPGAGIAKDLISGEPIETIKKTFEQEKNNAQESGYRIGFIRPNAQETRAALEQLFEKSLDDIPLMKNWEVLT